MSRTAPSASATTAGDVPAWRVRPAAPDEAAPVAAAVAELLRELGATPPAAPAMMAAARTLLDDPGAGTALVAESDGVLVGVLAASWQVALHVPGRYGIVQDLWVHPDWRGREIGASLLQALQAEAAALGIPRLEVGIPRDGFPGLEATRRFYERGGFTAVGARLRWEPS